MARTAVRPPIPYLAICCSKCWELIRRKARRVVRLPGAPACPASYFAAQKYLTKALLSVSAKCPIVHNATFQPRRALQFGERRRGGGPEPDTFSTASHSLRKQDSKKIRASYIFLWTFKNRSCTVEMRRDRVSLMR